MIKNARLPLKSENRGINIGLAQQDTGIVDEVAGREIVGPIGNDIVICENFEGIFSREAQVVLHKVYIRILRLQSLDGGGHFRLADIGQRKQHLSLQIGGVDDITIQHADCADAGRREVLQQRRTETACAHDQDLGSLELALALDIEFWDDQMTAVARQFFIGKFDF